MNDQTLVAVYERVDEADAAVTDLKNAGVSAECISQHTKTSVAEMRRDSTQPKEGFWANLFGIGPNEYDSNLYDRSVEEGSTVVTVYAANDDYDKVSNILEAHNPSDLSERASVYGISDKIQPLTESNSTSFGKPPLGVAKDDATMQLSEEKLAVGKRQVAGGTTRIRKYVVNTPVEEQVTLRGEKVTLERRPVTEERLVADADFADRTIEMTETDEVPVITKTVRVKEEVSLRKEATERVETVKDTVRREEVEIEEVPSERAASLSPGSIAPTRPDPRKI